jgi:hypothetical protein
MKRKVTLVALILGVVLLGVAIEVGPTTEFGSCERAWIVFLSIIGATLLTAGIIFLIPDRATGTNARIPKP